MVLHGDLDAALVAIGRADQLSSADRKAAVRRAIEVALLGTSALDTSERAIEAVLGEVEDVKRKAGVALGLERNATYTEVHGGLRSRGFKEVAQEFHELDLGRRSLAHRDGGISERIVAALASSTIRAKGSYDATLHDPLFTADPCGYPRDLVEARPRTRPQWTQRDALASLSPTTSCDNNSSEPMNEKGAVDNHDSRDTHVLEVFGDWRALPKHAWREIYNSFPAAGADAKSQQDKRRATVTKKVGLIHFADCSLHTGECPCLQRFGDAIERCFANCPPSSGSAGVD